MNKTIRLAFWGPGHMGGAAVRMAAERPEFEIVGARVYSDSKHGKDLGELVGIAPLGVAATNNVDDILALEADTVIHTAQAFDRETMLEDCIKLLESGKNVVTSAAYHCANTMGEEVVAKLESACKKGNSSFKATGIHPSFIGERLAMTLTGLMNKVDHIKVLESCDCGVAFADMAPEFTQAVGFGLKPEEINKEVGSQLIARYYIDVISFVGQRVFGVRPEDICFEFDYEGIPADKDYQTPLGLIKKGHSISISHITRGYIGDHHFMTNEECWWLTDETRFYGKAPLPIGEAYKGTSNYVITVSGEPVELALQMDVGLTTPGPIPAVTYNSAVALVQNAARLVSSPAGIIEEETTPYCAADYRQL